MRIRRNAKAYSLASAYLGRVRDYGSFAAGYAARRPRRAFLVAAGMTKTNAAGLVFSSGCARIFRAHTKRGAMLQMLRSLCVERALGWTFARVTIEEWK